MTKLITENFFETTTNTVINQNETGEIAIQLLRTPVGQFGILVLDDETENREEIFFHRRSGSTIYTYQINRENPKHHNIGASVIMNDSAGILNFLSDNTFTHFYIYKKSVNEVYVFGGKIYNGEVINIESKSIQIYDGYNYIYVDEDYVIQHSMTMPNRYVVGLVTKSGSSITIEKYNLIGFGGQKGDTGDPGRNVESVTKISTVGLVDTYRIEFSDSTHTDFLITNGAKGDKGDPGDSGNVVPLPTYTISGVSTNRTIENSMTVGEIKDVLGTLVQDVQDGLEAIGSPGVGIISITKTGTVGLVDTYTITFSDLTTTTFDITNGSPGAGGGQITYDAIVANYGGDYTSIAAAVNAGKERILVRQGVYSEQQIKVGVNKNLLIDCSGEVVITFTDVICIKGSNTDNKHININGANINISGANNNTSLFTSSGITTVEFNKCNIYINRQDTSQTSYSIVNGSVDKCKCTFNQCYIKSYNMNGVSQSCEIAFLYSNFINTHINCSTNGDYLSFSRCNINNSIIEAITTYTLKNMIYFGFTNITNSQCAFSDKIFFEGSNVNNCEFNSYNNSNIGTNYRYTAISSYILNSKLQTNYYSERVLKIQGGLAIDDIGSSVSNTTIYGGGRIDIALFNNRVIGINHIALTSSTNVLINIDSYNSIINNNIFNGGRYGSNISVNLGSQYNTFIGNIVSCDNGTAIINDVGLGNISANNITYNF